MTKHDVFMEVYELLGDAMKSLNTSRWCLNGAKDGHDGSIEAHETTVADNVEKVTALTHIHGVLFKDGWYKNNEELPHVEV